MASLKVGKPDVSPTPRRTRRACNQGNAKGNYEKQVGHLPDGRVDRRALDGHGPGRARPDRPADAEPAAGLTWSSRCPPRSPGPARRPS